MIENKMGIYVHAELQLIFSFLLLDIVDMALVVLKLFALFRSINLIYLKISIQSFEVNSFKKVNTQMYEDIPGTCPIINLS